MSIGDRSTGDRRPTFSIEGLGERSGSRAVSLGEKPYINPQSTSRREAQRAARK
ncbi:hypothetical protein Sste5346_009667 [Sporothrix stenoceras]|uniref:Uncharacterized protein n=1 Tax=Sporothrix stenoceras TaxID=5173 RepID=A0ABR3YJR6_9PEZI